MTSCAASRPAMGTTFEVLLAAPGHLDLQAAAEEALDLIQQLEARWSAFRPSSEISRLNRNAAAAPVRVTADLMRLLLRLQVICTETLGALDPTVGALLELWGFRGTPRAHPTPEELAAARSVTGMDLVDLDPHSCTARFRRPGVKLDLGACGKGYALDAAADACREAGIPAGLLHAGTSTCLAFGQPDSNGGWNIGIPHPSAARAGLRAADLEQRRSPGALIGAVALRDQALSLSAVWGRTTRCGDSRVGHIIDPRSGHPVEEVEMAVVIADSALEADAFSTALLVGGPALQSRLSSVHNDWRSLIVMKAAPREAPQVLDSGLLTTRPPTR